MYGKTHTDKTKQILRESCIKHNETFWTEENRLKHAALSTGINNGMYGKTHTDENKRLISERMSGENNPNYGGMSDTHRKNMSIAAKNHATFICPHCHIEANKLNINRWHMDKCKKKRLN